MSAPLPAADAAPPTRTELHCLVALLVIAALLRLGVICWKPELLVEDRDLYWGIANRLVAGDGFSHPDLRHPTAYRPPLYPLLLSVIVLVGGGSKTLAVVQIGLSVATVWLTWRLARKFGGKSNALLAAALVVFNPLLIQSTALAMTETLCAFLLMGLLLSRFVPTSRTRWLVGALVGLAALCRPTVWAFVALASVVTVAGWLKLRSSGSHRAVREVVREWWPIVVACGLTIAPWVIRNWMIFGQPIVTTTHGGYTLLLGNNNQAYAAEIAHPTDTSWDSREFQHVWEIVFWELGVESWDEVRRDEVMSASARGWIGRHPREFAESCWLRVRRFWNIFPGGADAGSLPKFARWGVAVFFAIELLAAAIGLWRLRRDEWAMWWPLVLLVLSFALVHVVYWSNLRMRAPVEPVLALLAARGLVPNRAAEIRTKATELI